MTGPEVRPALLVLSDGETFEGEALGATAPGGIATGEVVFNTVLSGYQEVISDPSYAGQIITFTYPHIGSYGVAGADDESRRPWARGVIVRDLVRRPSNWRSDGGLEEWLRARDLPAIGGIDTRRLTRHLRDHGSIVGAFGPVGPAADGTTVDEAALLAAARREPGTAGVDLVAEVTTEVPYVVEGGSGYHVVAYDFGIKSTILRNLAGLGRVEVVPATTPAEEVLARRPDGVFLSNGPGDPSAVPYAVDNVRALLGQVPMFGICLGHQILGLAVGAETVKLPFGHHGGNHPVRDLRSGKIEITSQNHNFAVDPDTLPPDGEVTHINLNDGVCQGFSLVDRWAFGVQHHPEAGPGPRESRYLFAEFAAMMERRRQGLAPGAEVAVTVGAASGYEPYGLVSGHLRRGGVA